MAYGYIPSPFGGKPSSLDIAKAAKRDRVKDAYVRSARKTPMSRAELERTEKPTGLDYMGLTDSTELANDRMYRDKNLLSDVNLASNTPKMREMKQDRANPDVQSVEDSRHADFDQYEYLDKSRDNRDKELDASRTPNGRARAVTRERNEGREPLGMFDTYDKRSPRYTTAYDAYTERKAAESRDDSMSRGLDERDLDSHPVLAERTPTSREIRQYIDGDAPDRGGDENIVGRGWGRDTYAGEPSLRKSEDESIDKSKGSPFEEYDAMRTPHGRARAASTGGKKGEVPYYSKNNRSFTQEDIAREEDAIDNTGESLEISHKRGKGDNPVDAERTPQGRAWAQHGDTNSRGSGFERDERGQLKDVVGLEHIHKSDESINKTGDYTFDDTFVDEDIPDQFRTPYGRADAIAMKETGMHDPYWVHTSQNRWRTHKDDEYKGADIEDYWATDGGVRRAFTEMASVTPTGRANSQFMGDRNEYKNGVSRFGDEPIDWDKRHDSDWTEKDTYAGKEFIIKSEPPTGDEIPYEAMRTPQGRARASFEANNRVGGPEPRLETYWDDKEKERIQDEARERSYEHEAFDTDVLRARKDPSARALNETAEKYMPEIQSLPSDRYGEIGGMIREQVANGSRIPDVDSVGKPGIYKSEGGSIGKVEGWVEPDEYKALRTPVGRDMAIARAKYPELDGVSVYAGLSGDQLRTRGMDDDLDENQDRAPPSPEEYEYAGVEHAYKSASASIHKSIQTPVRELIKKRREWR